MCLVVRKMLYVLFQPTPWYCISFPRWFLGYRKLELLQRSPAFFENVENKESSFFFS